MSSTKYGNCHALKELVTPPNSDRIRSCFQVNSVWLANEGLSLCATPLHSFPSYHLRLYPIDNINDHIIPSSRCLTRRRRRPTTLQLSLLLYRQPHVFSRLWNALNPHPKSRVAQSPAPPMPPAATTQENKYIVQTTLLYIT